MDYKSKLLACVVTAFSLIVTSPMVYAVNKEKKINAMQWLIKLDSEYSVFRENIEYIDSIDANLLSEAEELCRSNKLLNIGISDYLKDFKKEDPNNPFISILASNRPRYKACTLTISSIAMGPKRKSLLAELSAIKIDSVAKGEKALAILKKPREEMQALKKIDFGEQGAGFRSEFIGKIDTASEILNENISNFEAELNKLRSNEALSKNNISQVDHIDYSIGKIYCKSGFVSDVFNDCKSKGNHRICDSMANEICNSK